MARHGRSRVAFLAALTVGAVLVAFEALVRYSSLAESSARTPSSLVSEVMASTLDVSIIGWPALVVPVVLVLLLGLLIDGVSGTRR